MDDVRHIRPGAELLPDLSQHQNAVYDAISDCEEEHYLKSIIKITSFLRLEIKSKG